MKSVETVPFFIQGEKSFYEQLRNKIPSHSQQYIDQYGA